LRGEKRIGFKGNLAARQSNLLGFTLALEPEVTR